MKSFVRLLVTLLAVPCAFAQLSFEFLGVSAVGVSADGRAVIGYDTDGGFRYTLDSGAFESLPFLPSDINGDGSVIVGITHSSVGPGRINVWNDGVTTQPADLPSAYVVRQAPYSSAIAGYGTTGFVSNGGVTTEIVVPGGHLAAVLGISGDGSVVVGGALTGGFRYEAGVFTSLAPGLGEATAISPDGSTIVGWNGYVDETGAHSIPYPAGVPSSSGALTPYTVSDGGLVIAGSFPSFAYDAEAFVWTRTLGTVPLSSLVSVPEGWVLNTVADISGDGSVLVGTAFTLDGMTPRGFIVRGFDGFTPVPEPSTYGLAAVVLLGAVTFVRHRRELERNGRV